MCMTSLSSPPRMFNRPLSMPPIPTLLDPAHSAPPKRSAADILFGSDEESSPAVPPPVPVPTVQNKMAPLRPGPGLTPAEPSANVVLHGDTNAPPTASKESSLEKWAKSLIPRGFDRTNPADVAAVN